MPKAPPSIAATSTLAMVRTAAARGIETGDLLARADLTLAALEDPDARLPGPIVVALWNALRERAADPALQLTAPTSLPFGAYRVIDYLVATSATVGDGVRRFVRFFGLIADAVSLTLDHDDDVHCLTLVMADGTPVPPVYVDYVFAALVGRIRMRIRPALAVARVTLRRPPPADATPYAALFDGNVRFGASADRLCFADAEWRAPTDSADAALGHIIEEHARMLAQRVVPSGTGFRQDVERTIAAALPEGGSAADVARALHVSVRTLQRRLVALGTTFRGISESVCSQLAVEYLSDPRVSIAEVTFLLGFSDQSSFNRAFRRWTGASPGRWRRRHVGKAATARAAFRA